MTSTQTPNLDLPYIMPGQAQKHVTHNEAIRQLDAVVHLSVAAMNVSDPPMDPAEGARYGVSSNPSGLWAANPNAIAVWQDGAWAFLTPQDGWTLWVVQDTDFQIYSEGVWTNLLPDAPTEFDNLDHVGINAAADNTNRLSLASDASLFNHNGADHRLKINKNSHVNIASILMQTGFSGRAEFGLVGDDRVTLKTSTDGTVWTENLRVDAGEAGIQVPALRSGRLSIDVDSVTDIPTPSAGGIVAITLTGAAGFPQSYHSGLFVYDTGPSLGLYTLVKLSGLDNKTQTILTGTTGAVNKTSISVQSGVIQIENRYASTREYTYTFLT